MIAQTIYTATFTVLLSLLAIDANTFWLQLAAGLGALWFLITLGRIVIAYHIDQDNGDF